MNAVTVLVTYRPKKGKDKAFLSILKRHWPALKKAGLVTRTPARVWNATDKRRGRRYYVEMFAWKDVSASDRAHQTPAVMAVWGPMQPLLESMDIAVVEPVAL